MSPAALNASGAPLATDPMSVNVAGRLLLCEMACELDCCSDSLVRLLRAQILSVREPAVFSSN
eukprot:CAMPEP_0184325214 /NCGR_PEP_ID=MMETSP1049-20130417/139322_1 /TAXON_ID=77928 /ORGANISM="Proteomonas sulcata, Strain CCMP704" /LENGTH=62 /DNA_ID=CAMNT_0026647211 /DNA_START=117 /DNA_END=302 /DNA_ORIENTATION=-